MSATMVEQYTGQKIEIPPEKEPVEDELKEQPIVTKKSKIEEPKKELTLEQLKKMSDEAFERGDTKRLREIRIMIHEFNKR